LRCGNPAKYQWNICALNPRVYHPICEACDIALNALVLEFMGVDDREAIIERYKATVANE
jgi:hypothetical protein